MRMYDIIAKKRDGGTLTQVLLFKKNEKSFQKE